jgi:hypothetical protein
VKKQMKLRKVTALKTHRIKNKFLIQLECGHHMVCDSTTLLADEVDTNTEYPCAVCTDMPKKKKWKK